MGPRKFTLPPNKTILTKQIFPNHFQDVYDAMLPSSTIPDEFDSRQNWPFMQKAWDDGIMGPFDQEQCGSCWAFATTECLQWKISIHSGIPIPRLSQQYLVDSVHTVSPHSRQNCVGKLYIDKVPALRELVKDPSNWTMNGCNGSSTIAPVCFTVDNFIPLNSSYPYTGKVSKKHPHQFTYENGVKGVLARGVSAVEGDFGVGPTDITRMKQAIMVGGPIIAAFMVREDFMKYWVCGYNSEEHDTSDERFVYKSNTSSPLDGGHAVLAIGWGKTSKGTSYWIVQNSWGKWDSSLLKTNPCKNFDEELHKGSPVDEGLFYIAFNDPSGFESQCTSIYVDKEQAKCFAQNIISPSSSVKDCSLIRPGPPPVIKPYAKKWMREGYNNYNNENNNFWCCRDVLISITITFIVILIIYFVTD